MRAIAPSWWSRDSRPFFTFHLVPWGMGLLRLWCSGFMLKRALFTWAAGSMRSFPLIGRPSWILDLEGSQFWLNLWASQWWASFLAFLTLLLGWLEGTSSLLMSPRFICGGWRRTFLGRQRWTTSLLSDSSSTSSVVAYWAITSQCWLVGCWQTWEWCPS